MKPAHAHHYRKAIRKYDFKHKKITILSRYLNKFQIQTTQTLSKYDITAICFRSTGPIPETYIQHFEIQIYPLIVRLTVALTHHSVHLITYSKLRHWLDKGDIAHVESSEESMPPCLRTLGTRCNNPARAEGNIYIT